MNRWIVACVVVLAVWMANVASAQETVFGYEARSQKYPAGPAESRLLNYRLRAPAKMKKGEKYPLVLFLHGAGERGDDNQKQLKFLPTWLAEEPYASQFPCFVIAPQCPGDRIWASFHWKQPPEEMKLAPEPTPELSAVIGILERALQELPVDRSRVYLTGLSMGGYGTWELAARHPELFAAAAPICGGGDVSQAAKLVNLPIWCWHGGADTVVPPDYSRAMVEAVKKAGGKKIEYAELPGVGHDSWSPAYRKEDGVVPWLFRQKLSGAK